MRSNLSLVDDETIHHADPDVLWLATLCGLRRTAEDRASQSLRLTNGIVDCMTCLVLQARSTR